MKPVRERDAVRGIVLSPQHEILLLRIRSPGGGTFWITPGGGREPGENSEACLRRELREELGLEQFTLGPLVWRRQHTFDWGSQRILQREEYYVVHADPFEPNMSDEIERELFDRFQWWHTHELNRTREPVTPRALASIVASHLRDGAPLGPLEMEVLVD